MTTFAEFNNKVGDIIRECGMRNGKVESMYERIHMVIKSNRVGNLDNVCVSGMRFDIELGNTTFWCKTKTEEIKLAEIICFSFSARLDLDYNNKPSWNIDVYVKEANTFVQKLLEENPNFYEKIKEMYDSLKEEDKVPIKLKYKIKFA